MRKVGRREGIVEERKKEAKDGKRARVGGTGGRERRRREK